MDYSSIKGYAIVLYIRIVTESIKITLSHSYRRHWIGVSKCWVENAIRLGFAFR